MLCQNVLITFATLLVSTVVIITAEVKTDQEAQMYLSRFGYLPEPNYGYGPIEMIHENTMIQAIQSFQEFAGLDVTGTLNGETLAYMSLPRCGVKDTNPYGRSKRFASHGIPGASVWRKKNLTYKISQYTRRMDPTEVDAAILRAFNVWSEHTDLSFTQKRYGTVDIDIKFAQGSHGDGNAFDGPGGTLAHAFPPEYGDAHFDDAEYWTINNPFGTDLFQVAAHEFGHSLGLDQHSTTKEALMYAFYQGYNPYFRLHSDDITRIQNLYGPKTKQIENGEKEASSNNDRSNCNNASKNGYNTNIPPILQFIDLVIGVLKEAAERSEQDRSRTTESPRQANYGYGRSYYPY